MCVIGEARVVEYGRRRGLKIPGPVSGVRVQVPPLAPYISAKTQNKEKER